MSVGLGGRCSRFCAVSGRLCGRDAVVQMLGSVDGQGSLQGLLSADDAIELIAEAMNNLTKLVKREITREEKEWD